MKARGIRWIGCWLIAMVFIVGAGSVLVFAQPTVAEENKDILDSGLSVKLLEQHTPKRMIGAGMYKVSITLQNDGKTVWKQDELLFLSYHWLNEDQSVHVWDGLRTKLPHDVEPGEQITVKADVKAPGEGGNYFLQWDMVYEGAAWFGDTNPESLQSVSVHVYGKWFKYVWIGGCLLVLVLLVRLLKRK
ncbi:NBR1-Ig-like domain-containing protein [Paenibacillus xylaniclasticus]|uniref:NBR1-Ig-like domain-containing protein n=1 Tax=Paenibacillus xylaniclasticus TaxID=588083 RepID=UPI000FD8DA9C|nr:MULTISPECIES: NBR1-Ig-like domain-containing protein [Paenibacillus]GFN32790.1 hypothetical protein PCURB6_30500 [Paenibacillus curdlanolyticus]